MAAVTKLQVYPEIRLPVRSEFSRKCMNPNSIQLLGRCGRNCRGLYRKICRSFKEGNDFEEKDKGAVDFEGNGPGELKEGSGSAILSSLKSAILSISKWPSCSAEEYRNKSAELEEVFFSIALQIGRYIVTMMNTGVILLTGFQMSGGDTQMNHLIWYSWLGGIIIGTMVGANMVLDEHSRAGPRNVVITGSTRGSAKHLLGNFFFLEIEWLSLPAVLTQ
ncbi:hypothetical protein Nepgr_019871 [Nepenthes gracilis]|uniref:Uncharacterized protein n=1 Tax=Nepenthes gracilis TaxID=150966 RepID=A0AAD3XVM1_NEPGR|nr:hypothetical protein Nepgr_019871 [Nepenthes gracilis]